MKKLLSILSVLGISATAPSVVMSCSSNTENKVKDTKSDEKEQFLNDAKQQFDEIDKSMKVLNNLKAELTEMKNTIDHHLSDLVSRKEESESVTNNWSSQIDDFNKQIKESRARKKALINEKDELIKANINLTSSKFEKEDKVNNLKGINSQLTTKSDHLNITQEVSQISTKEKEIERLEVENHSITSHNREISEKWASENDKLDELKAQLTESHVPEGIDDLNDEIEASERMIEIYKRDHETNEYAIIKNMKQIEALNNEIKELKDKEKQLIEVNEQIKINDQQIANLENEIKELDNQISENKKQDEAGDKELEQLDINISNYKKEIIKANKQIELNNPLINEINKQIEPLQIQREEIINQLNEANEKIASLQSIYNSLNELVNALN